ncbi:MAG TPA: DNA polymerase III subunit gamma/tau [Gammaproteobacteria bacterium]|nr:DNA polymerase III subunit gamma/tau [Gammaproteobacteria bacterium]
MSYQVLARKWRPQNFQQLVGQEHVQRALVNALNDDRLHHAYLFTGTRGVGKTTIARIFSKSLNCETGITATPCGECATCREIAEGRYVDLIEVDAASRTGVDDTRELLENVQYAPTRGRYKVYLIDEVHMFSKSSFNALLKTLEEPPPHVKFLLATTDPQKLPVTILSRCLQFNLKRLPVSLIISHLQYILGEEKVDYNVTALQLIAEAADGSMRDALSLLDQALAFGGGSVQEQEVRDMLGSVSRDKVLRLLNAIIARDASQTLKVVAELAEFSPDFENVLAELISLLHHMSLAKTVPEALDEYVSAREQLLELSEQVSAEDLQLFYQIALIGRRDLPLAPDMRNGFEMIMLRMLAFRPAAVDAAAIQYGSQQAVSSTSQVSEQVPPAAPSSSSRSSPAQAAPQSSVSQSAAAQPVPAAVASEPQVTPAATPSVQPAASGDWREIVNALGLGGLVKQLAINCTMKQRDGCNIVLQIAQGHSNLINAKAKQRLQQALGEYFNIDAQLQIEVTGQTAAESPAQTIQRETRQRQQQAEQAITEDSFAQALKENFNAELVPGSVKPVNSD